MMISFKIQVFKSNNTCVLCTFQTSAPDADIATIADTLIEALKLILQGLAYMVAIYPVFQIQTLIYYYMA